MVILRSLCFASLLLATNTSMLGAEGRSFKAKNPMALAMLSTNRISTSTQRQSAPFSSSVISIAALRGGETSEEVLADAYEWCTNLGSPAALVAGAVIATIYDNIKNGDLNHEEHDALSVRILKKTTRMLLLSAFALEVVSIFVSTVTGTMLLGRSADILAKVKIVDATTPLSFLWQNYEFEYLTIRITFLQGLLNWLAAIGLNHFVPTGESKATAYVNRFVGGCLLTIILLMISFYNTHTSFYPNYLLMLSRWLSVSWSRYVWRWPIRPMALLYVPAGLVTLYWGFQAFVRPEEPRDFKKEEEWNM